MDSPKFCCLFLDNSNFFKSTQQTLAKGKKFFSRNVNIDYMKLRDFCRKDREIKYALNAYGAMEDNIKFVLEKAGFEPKTGKLNRKNQEKQVDTQLAVDATEIIVRYGKVDRQLHGGTIIIVSGDSDFIPVIEVAKNWGWKVEVCCFKSTTHNIYRNKENTENPILINYLDEHVEDFTVKTPYKTNGDEIKVTITIINGFQWWFTLYEAARDRIKNEIQSVAEKILDLPIVIKDSEGSLPDHEIEIIVAVRRQDLEQHNYLKEIQGKLNELEKLINETWARGGYQKVICVNTQNALGSGNTSGDTNATGQANAGSFYCRFCEQTNPKHPRNQCPEFGKNLVCNICKQKNPQHPKNRCPEFGTTNKIYCKFCNKENPSHPKGQCPAWRK